MNPGLAAVAVAVVAAGVVAVSVRESRIAVLALTLAGIAAPLIADPLPGLLPLAVRIVATVLGGYLLWVVVRSGPVTAGSRLSWPVESSFAAAAAVAGFAAVRIVAGGPTLGAEGPNVIVELGPREALAAGTALAVLAVAPVLLFRDVLQLGIGLSLGLLAAALIRVGLDGSPTALDQILTAGVRLSLAAAIAAVAATALRTVGSLDVRQRPRAAAGPLPRTVEAGAAEATDGVVPRSGLGRRSIPGR